LKPFNDVVMRHIFATCCKLAINAKLKPHAALSPFRHFWPMGNGAGQASRQVLSVYVSRSGIDVAFMQGWVKQRRRDRLLLIERHDVFEIDEE
jgi:hypothetical protein